LYEKVVELVPQLPCAQLLGALTLVGLAVSTPGLAIRLVAVAGVAKAAASGAMAVLVNNNALISPNINRLALIA
jgi:hypothetical protein